MSEFSPVSENVQCTWERLFVSTCERIHLADAGFSNGLAYDAQPDDSRLGELIDNILMDLSKSELEELEVLRMPFADIGMIPS